MSIADFQNPIFPALIAALLVFILSILFLVLWLGARSALTRARKKLEASSGELAKMTSKYEPISSIETEVAKLQAEAERTSRQIGELQSTYAQKREIEVAKLRAATEAASRQIERLRSSYAQKREILLKLEAQAAIYEDKLSFAELGVYEPHFNYTDSEAYKKAITEVREKQKAMVSAKSATICPTDWTVDGSRAKGQTMINRQTRLTMRAFNNECEAAIANTRWNNVNAMEKRILNAASQIDKANESMMLSISQGYVALKVNELHLAHEYRERLKIEREERADSARAEREEKRLLADAAAAEREERKFQTLLEKARAEAGIDEARIAELEAALADAHATSERARAMAEMTKSGYVYIISSSGTEVHFII